MFKTHKAIKIIGILFLFFAISAFSTNMSNKESLATLKEEYKTNLEKLEEVKSNEELLLIEIRDLLKKQTKISKNK